MINSFLDFQGVHYPTYFIYNRNYIMYLFSEYKNNNHKFIVFEAATTISNNGLSIGITSMDIDSLSKMILSFNIIIKKYKIIAILYIFISRLRR